MRPVWNSAQLVHMQISNTTAKNAILLARNVKDLQMKTVQIVMRTNFF